MAIKLLARIKLPFILRMKKAEIIKVSFSDINEFSILNITFYPNLDNSDLYNYHYLENNCFFIDVEAVTNILNHHDYEEERELKYAYYIPDQDRVKVFSALKEILNEYFYYIKVKTHMFWIEDLPMNPLSGVIGTLTEFVFINPNEIVTEGFRVSETIFDDYQTEINTEKIIPIDSEIVKKPDDIYLVKSVWVDYSNKARIALFSSEYSDFIIYSAITAESFIKQLIHTSIKLDNQEDIVLKKLVQIGKNNFVESYYKIILKYLCGKSLYEIKPSLYNNLLNLYKFRNAIMHSGEVDKEDIKKAGYEGIEELTFEICLNMYTTLEESIEVVMEMVSKKM